MPNLLAGETSPYLLQHKDNPVDWHPWGEEALERARREDRPLLVSIGYAACHWCHVMERECFENERIAALMNASFVCVKVDREERPDIDAICMEACQGMTGQGGWPLNVFLTPDGRPFYAGTYFPPEPRSGMPSWPMVLEAIATAWRERREAVLGQGRRVAESLAVTARLAPEPEALREVSIERCVEALRESFDERHGGFGGAPKFPPHCTLELLLAAGEREMSLATLRSMSRGGIYDQIGGGFARYAVDAAWGVPHFEKMLYDNALLARAYLHGHQVSGETRLREVCCETLDFCLRELRGPEGGFASSLDADSEGAEGSFYVWSEAELRSVLGSRAQEALAYFGATERGNFEGGRNVLRAVGAAPQELPAIREALLAARSERARPALDDKRLTAWNALMIAALADAGAVLDRQDYLTSAVACAEFVLDGGLREPGGRLLRTWKDGRGHLAGYLEDHAYLLEALLVLYEATFEPRWYAEALELAETILTSFSDPRNGGFFTTAEDQEVLVARRRDLEDVPVPSGSSSAALGLLRLARLSGEARFERAAEGVLHLHGRFAATHPAAFGHLLRAIDLWRAPSREIAVIGGSAEGAGPLLRVLRSRFRAHEVIAGGAPGSGDPLPPLLAGRGLVDGRAAAYVCERFSCRAPVCEPEALERLLG